MLENCIKSVYKYTLQTHKIHIELSLCMSLKRFKNIKFEALSFFSVALKGLSPRLPPPLASLLLQLPHSEICPNYPHNTNAFQ